MFDRNKISFPEQMLRTCETIVHVTYLRKVIKLEQKIWAPQLGHII
jgi:hypothetical protein